MARTEIMSLWVTRQVITAQRFPMAWWSMARAILANHGSARLGMAVPRLMVMARPSPMAPRSDGRWHSAGAITIPGTIRGGEPGPDIGPAITIPGLGAARWPPMSMAAGATAWWRERQRHGPIPGPAITAVPARADFTTLSPEDAAMAMPRATQTSTQATPPQRRAASVTILRPGASWRAMAWQRAISIRAMA